MNRPDRIPPVPRHERPGLRVLRPVCGHARLRARDGIARRDDENGPELFDPETGASHRLSQAAADLWAALDGRELRELRPGSDPDDATESDVDLAVVELVRRFKALGVIEDLP